MNTKPVVLVTLVAAICFSMMMAYFYVGDGFEIPVIVSTQGGNNGGKAPQDDQELLDYLLSESHEAYRYAYEMDPPLDVLISGEETWLEGEWCRDVWFGTDHDDHFSREIQFTIAPSGAVYKNDVMIDAWVRVNNRDDDTMAFVQLDYMIDDDYGLLRVDDVVWVDDLTQPNGYRLENDDESWEVYIINMWTECHVFAPSETLGIESYQVSLDNFLATLEAREGTMLVQFAANHEGLITYIAEVYTP